MVIFETPRLLVRQLDEGDIDALYAVFSDPLVVRWVGDGKPLTYEQCAQWVAVSAKNYVTKGFGASAVIDKETGAFTGICGIVYGPGRDEPEIVYGFGQPWWGRGIASEVVAPMLRYGVERCGLPRVMATIAPENSASRRVAERAGMRFDREEIDPEDGLPVAFYYYEIGRRARGIAAGR
jgi:[ribosomal protein S5]-alanine N-acetyltransferase